MIDGWRQCSKPEVTQENVCPSRRALKFCRSISTNWIISVADLTESPAYSPTPEHNPHLPRTPRWLFQWLNSMIMTRLSVTKFWQMFRRCGVCGLVTMRQVYSFHYCQPIEVIDLTMKQGEQVEVMVTLPMSSLYIWCHCTEYQFSKFQVSF